MDHDGNRAFRPLGGFIFGLLADRYGRMPLMVNVAYFSLIEVLCLAVPVQFQWGNGERVVAADILTISRC